MKPNRSLALLTWCFLTILLTGVADASEERRFVRLEHVPFMHVSDEQVFACACPGVVDFCKRWDKEWRHLAVPELRNQTVRECVIDGMLALEGP
jgi:hypothetical protein